MNDIIAFASMAFIIGGLGVLFIGAMVSEKRFWADESTGPPNIHAPDLRPYCLHCQPKTECKQCLEEEKDFFSHFY